LIQIFISKQQIAK